MNRGIENTLRLPSADIFQLDPITRDPLMRMSVMLRTVKEDGSLGETLIGHVVTHMPIDEWCKVHGYWLQQSYPITTRRALRGEATELF